MNELGYFEPGTNREDPVLSQQPRTMSASELLCRQFPPRQHVIDPWIPERGLGLVYGVLIIGMLWRQVATRGN